MGSVEQWLCWWALHACSPSSGEIKYYPYLAGADCFVRVWLTECGKPPLVALWKGQNHHVIAINGYDWGESHGTYMVSFVDAANDAVCTEMRGNGPRSGPLLFCCHHSVKKLLTEEEEGHEVQTLSSHLMNIHFQSQVSNGTQAVMTRKGHHRNPSNTLSIKALVCLF